MSIHQTRPFGLAFGLALTICIHSEAGDQKTKPVWKALFDGKSLAGWKETNFGGEGEVRVENGVIVMERGSDMTGITYAAGDFPKMNYEVTLEGKRVKGIDFFCTTTFPVGDTHCSLVVGGWAGSVVGLSTIDGADAMRNDTKTLHDFKDNQWYRLRIRVTQERIGAWIDDKQVVNLATKGKKISIRAETDLCRPFGIATWSTVGAVRDIKVRTLTADELKENEPKKESKRKLRFTISKETTYITEPLDKDGYPDYVTALNERMRKGVTPKNNAVALLMGAFGPRLEGRKQSAEFYRWLGINEPPDPGDYYRSCMTFMKDVLMIDPAIIQLQIQEVSDRPWSGKQYPHFVAWLKANDRPLAVAVEATKRDRYYYPLVVGKTEKGHAPLIGALLPGVQMSRDLAQTLSIRAMRRIGEGKFDEAWQDLLTMHRLGRLVAQGGTHIEGLVGVAIDTIASQGDVVLLAYARPTPRQIKGYLIDLQALPPIPSLAEKIDRMDRFTILQIMLMIDRHGPAFLENLSGAKQAEKVLEPDPLVSKLLASVDWNPSLRMANRWHDRIVAAIRVKDNRMRAKELDSIVDELKTLRKTIGDIGLANVLKDAENLQQGLGNRIGEIVIVLLTPAFQKVQQAFDRTEQTHRNLHLAFALAAYQKDNGHFPKTLDALAPKYLAKIPEDLFSGKAVKYLPKDNGYLLYSIGPNGVDEEGRWYDDDPPGDDPRVRMPLPPPKRD